MERCPHIDRISGTPTFLADLQLFITQRKGELSFQLGVVTTFIYWGLRLCLHYSSNTKFKKNALRQVSVPSEGKASVCQLNCKILVKRCFTENKVFLFFVFFLSHTELNRHLLTLQHCIAIPISGHRAKSIQEVISRQNNFQGTLTSHCSFE